MMSSEILADSHSSEALPKSVITCDMEGRIETFNTGAETIFGYTAAEVVGKKRVSLFSPGLVVLEHVPTWLKAAREQGEYEGATVFERKDGSELAAHIKITPTKKNGEQIGYCGVSTMLEDEQIEKVRPSISLFTKIFSGLVITRAPFLTAALVPIFLAAAGAIQAIGWEAFSGLNLFLVCVAGSALHISANTFNDYFDWTSGTDQANNDYFLPFSGGSRAIELRLIQPSTLLWIGTAALVASTLIGLYSALTLTPDVLLFGLIGAFSAFFYTAPPLRLVARKGLGELFVGLNFGPLMVAGALTVFLGGLTSEVILTALYLGVPAGLLTTAILWINEFPDAESDAKTGKNNLVVVLGKATARYGYVFLTLSAFVWLILVTAGGFLPTGALLGLLALPMALMATRNLFKHFEDRALIRSNVLTIQLHLAVGLLMTVGLLWLG
jgi:1,4-dihydroxy-2-naphthoate polyprenyltransferase